jgi:hypothetical protein
MPKAIGTQITSERRYPWKASLLLCAVGLEFLQVEPEEREESEHAEDHRERVVIDVAGLDAAGAAANQPMRRAVPFTMIRR